MLCICVTYKYWFNRLSNKNLLFLKNTTKLILSNMSHKEKATFYNITNYTCLCLHKIIQQIQLRIYVQTCASTSTGINWAFGEDDCWVAQECMWTYWGLIKGNMFGTSFLGRGLYFSGLPSHLCIVIATLDGVGMGYSNIPTIQFCN